MKFIRNQNQSFRNQREFFNKIGLQKLRKHKIKLIKTNNQRKIIKMNDNFSLRLRIKKRKLFHLNRQSWWDLLEDYWGGVINYKNQFSRKSYIARFWQITCMRAKKQLLFRRSKRFFVNTRVVSKNRVINLLVKGPRKIFQKLQFRFPIYVRSVYLNSVTRDFPLLKFMRLFLKSGQKMELEKRFSVFFFLSKTLFELDIKNVFNILCYNFRLMDSRKIYYYYYTRGKQKQRFWYFRDNVTRIKVAHKKMRRLMILSRGSMSFLNEIENFLSGELNQVQKDLENFIVPYYNIVGVRWMRLQRTIQFFYKWYKEFKLLTQGRKKRNKFRFYGYRQRRWFRRYYFRRLPRWFFDCWDLVYQHNQLKMNLLIKNFLKTLLFSKRKRRNKFRKRFCLKMYKYKNRKKKSNFIRTEKIKKK
jgi:hypothetical protein